MKVFILTEAGNKIGLGHISRCSSLYDELLNENLQVEFLIKSEIDYFEILEDRQYKVVDWQSRDFVSAYLKSDDFCIIDSYTVDSNLLEYIEQIVHGCLFLDDTGRIEYPKGIIVNPSLFTENIKYPNKDGLLYLLGKEYVILRQDFCNNRREQIQKEITNILITMGGSDAHNITPLLINEMVKKEIDVNIHVILGKETSINKDYYQSNYININFYENLNSEKICELMLKCDIGITAAGQTIYELLATNTPFIPIQTADNQKNNIDGLKKHGIIQDAISVKDPMFLTKIFKSYQELKQLDKRIQILNLKLIDGKGSKRIISNVLKSLYFLRDIDAEDMEDVFELSNESYVREYSINPQKINWEEHVNWFNKIIHSNKDQFYVISDPKGTFLGQIRYKVDENTAIVSVSLGKKILGKGLSQYFLENSMSMLKSRRKDVIKIIAFISTENIASQKAFKKAGFVYKDTNQKLQRYEFFY